MYRDQEMYGIYGTLPMQAALQLYLPHVEPAGQTAHRACPGSRRRRPGRPKPRRGMKQGGGSI